MSPRAARRLGLVALGVVSLVVALVWSMPADATSTGSPVYLQVTGVQGVQAPAGTSTAPFVVKSVPFDVTVSFLDSSGNPTTLPSGVSSLKLTDSLGDTLGTASNIPATAQSWQFQGVSIGTAANGVTLTASVPKGSTKSTSPVPSAPFDVLLTYASAPQNNPLTEVGGTNGSGGCSPTAGSPICADLLLPSGSDTSILMSLGLCDGLGKCVGSDAQALVRPGASYSKSSPATLIVKCDKSLCGGGGINKQQLAVQPSSGGGFTTAPPCPAKNVIGADQSFCVDYVQSTRDNAGDTYLYLLFTDDVRAHYT